MSHDDDAGRCNCRVCREGRELSRLLRVDISARRFLHALDAVTADGARFPAAVRAYEDALQGLRECLGEASP